MLDIRLLRNQPQLIKESLQKRGKPVHVVDEILAIDEKRRDKITQVDELKQLRKVLSKKIGLLKTNEKQYEKATGKADRLQEIRDKHLDEDNKNIDKIVAKLINNQQKYVELFKTINKGYFQPLFDPEKPVEPEKVEEQLDTFTILDENVVRSLGDVIRDFDEDVKKFNLKQQQILEAIPNIPSSKVPPGETDRDNIEVRRWGDIPCFDFEPRPHWDIGEELDIIDIPRAVKMAKSRFTLMKGEGALLERALINFMLDVQTRENGYTEIMPPYIVNYQTLFGTGQLPKFEEDLFKLNNDMYLIPTAEVPLTSYHAGEILEAEDLPRHYCGFTACFRSEAGAAGRDTRGLIRVHQFNKVELVKICHPEKSDQELEDMLTDAELVLQKLRIPYRVLIICIGDLGFSVHFKYDLEYWAPGMNRWVEVSSCSNCIDFQARRANIKFKEKNGKPQFAHTLNGSGLAVGRTLVAILENYQNADGTVTVPKVLRPYMNGLEVIGKK
ncbi:MAG: serine--tRNA ligase [Vulcanimicrobiota bacterium]